MHTLLHDVIESYYDTGERLLHKEVTPNIMARGLIYAWLQELPTPRWVRVRVRVRVRVGVRVRVRVRV